MWGVWLLHRGDRAHLNHPHNCQPRATPRAAQSSSSSSEQQQQRAAAVHSREMMLSRSSAASGPACKVGQHSQRATTVSTAALLHRCCTPSEREWRGKGGGPEDRGVAPHHQDACWPLGHTSARVARCSRTMDACMCACVRMRTKACVRGVRVNTHIASWEGGRGAAGHPPRIAAQTALRCCTCCAWRERMHSLIRTVSTAHRRCCRDHTPSLSLCTARRGHALDNCSRIQSRPPRPSALPPAHARTHSWPNLLLSNLPFLWTTHTLLTGCQQPARPPLCCRARDGSGAHPCASGGACLDPGLPG